MKAITAPLISHKVICSVLRFSFLYPIILESRRCERTRKKNIYIFIYTFRQSLQQSILQRYLTIQHLSTEIALSSIQYSRFTSISLWKLKPSLDPLFSLQHATDL